MFLATVSVTSDKRLGTFSFPNHEVAFDAPVDEDLRKSAKNVKYGEFTLNNTESRPPFTVAGNQEWKENRRVE